MSRLARFLSRERQRWAQRRLRRVFAQLGAGPGAESVELHGMAPFLDVKGALQFGETVSFRGVTRRVSIAVSPGATLKIGPLSYINQGASLGVTVGVTLGRRCLVGEDVHLFDTNFHEVDEGAGVFSAPVIIGDNVWIGNGAIILPGTRLGDHSVVAAGAVVKGEFAARSLIAGVPGRFIREIRCSDTFFRC